MSLLARGKRGSCHITMKKKLTLFMGKKKSLKNEKAIKEISDLGILSRTFLASIIIITIFFVSPVIVEFTKNTSLTSIEFENNSKDSLKRLLKKMTLNQMRS